MNAAPPLDRNQVTTLFDGKFTEFFGATLSASDELTSVQFYEKRPDLGEVTLLQSVGWEMHAPHGAQLRLGASGIRLDPLDNLWISWSQGDQLVFASLGQKQPGKLQLARGEQPIEPAIMVPGDVLLQFSWRSDAGALRVHRVHAPTDGPQMELTSAELAKVASVVLAAAAPIPGNSKELAHLFTLEAKPGADPCAVQRVVQGTKLVSERASEPIAGLTPLAPHRLATIVNLKGGAAMAYVARRDADGAVVLVLVSFGNQEPKVSVGTSVLPHEQQDAISGQAAFYTRPDELDFVVFTVDPHGALIMAQSDLEHARVLRKNVGADYGYPIFMAQGAAYEVHPDPKDGLAAVNIANP
jgi:hypothetical protein